ncbi:hypothetical protein I4U23_029078 [Adineta vaga]|nr:hypothetical protein I4U23_029078 [Adineta vaga]
MLFFHRHPSFFVYILSYYIYGFIKRPIHIPYDVYIEECRFFSIPIEDQNQSLHFNEMKNEKVIFRKSFYWFSFFLTILSCFILFFDDLAKSDFLYNQFTSDGQIVYNIILKNSISVWIDLNCTIWFMIEFYIRFSYLVIERDFQLYIDILSISPVCLFLLTNALSQWFPHLCLLYPYYICLKSFRILRLIRYIPDLDLIRKTLVLSLNYLSITLVLCSLFIIQFGLIIYLLERTDSSSNIVSPDNGLSWAIETLSTIGFGEFILHTFEGRILSIFACIFGLILFAIPIPLIFRKYQILYENSLKRNIWIRYR